MRRVNKDVYRRFAYMLLAWVMGLALSVTLLDPGRTPGDAWAHDTAEPSSQAFLPVIYYPSTPAGTYFCLEYEFGLIWTSETITLYEDGSSIYVYDAPYGGTATGTWTYTPALNEVAFTGFRWKTATYRFPNVLYASEYLPHVDFEIAVFCQREQ